jgi:hypothetical protein
MVMMMMIIIIIIIIIIGVIGHLDAIPRKSFWYALDWRRWVGPGGGVEVKCANSMATGNVLRSRTRCSGDSSKRGARLLIAVCIFVIKGPSNVLVIELIVNGNRPV